MIADLDTFIFKEISFKKIDSDPVNADNAKPISKVDNAKPISKVDNAKPISGGDDLATPQGNSQKEHSQQSKQPSNQQSVKNDPPKNIESGPIVDPTQPTTNPSLKLTNAPS
jgi:hypothetical protein